ncbi:DUF397 domain-containing protein [Sphaerisporangium rufum]|uniref:DUF397 domain-containing protein n=1 Tax=Sphaerisporangium rufum TaxID=1381558 RepID=UPI00194F91D0|nr:DUF397 domain-containing protein [Sphaerisporangium rufum]
MQWRKSSFSGNNGGNCVEIAELSRSPRRSIAVRDSKNPDGPKLLVGSPAWAAFLAGVKGDGFPRR